MKYLLVALLLLASIMPASAQLDPGRPIRIIAGYGAGGALDIAARAILDGVQARLGTTVVLENRPGGGGTLASELVARAAPDGHTLVMGGAGSHGVTAALSRNLPFVLDRDFIAIARIAEFPVVMMASPRLPVQTVQEFIAYARARPGQLNFGSSGVGTSLHLTGELFNLRAGTDLTHVPYRGSTGTSSALMSGDIQIGFDALPAVKGLIDQGLIRALAVTSASRLEELPNVPTMAEAGFPDFVVTSWVGPFGPAGMPRAVVDQLSRAFVEAALAPEGRARLRSLGAIAVGEDASTFDATWRRDMNRWREVVRAANITLEN